MAVSVSTMTSLVASEPFLSCQVVIAIRARVVLSSASFLIDLMSEIKTFFLRVLSVQELREKVRTIKSC